MYESFWKKIYITLKERLICNLNELNTNHDSIKFEYKISKTIISFLDTVGAYQE